MDFSIESLGRLFEQGELVIPAFARPMVWSQTQKSQFIESLLLELPVPPLFLSENPETYQYSVLDGAQRLRAAISYLHGEYALTGLTGIISANEMHFDALPIRMQRHLRMSTMRAVIISSASSSKIQAEVFFRLNTGGTALTTQELRNATHQGPFNTLTVELSRLSEFRRAIGAGPSSTGNLRDVELILRYFVLSEERGQEYTISQRAFTDFLQRKNESSPSELERYRTSFVKSLNKCLSAFEGETFRRWRPEVGKSDSRFSVPLYDAQMLAVQEFSSSQIFRHAHEIRLGMRKLFTSEEFKNSLKMTTVHSLDLRVSSVVEMIESVAR
ncbi:DUF262 domain-containing protein [Streptomyces sp. NBC_01220]|uniref:DUF262 domain-containing protein n=1 Tax=Streptomyces sp. NBC_01220 TaxID=2903781 RepID=UPI00352D60EA|nr:DUF262 domain-containing protein [Streptomyces sp. NBC_01220]